MALLYGKYDIEDKPEDTEYLGEQLGDNLVFSKEYELGHVSFVIGNDMSFMDDVLDLLEEYNKVSF